MTITDVIDSENKCIIEIELDEDFEEKFVKSHRIRKWNDAHFESWFKNILRRVLITIEKGGYDTVYDVSTADRDVLGDIKDAQVGDIVSFWKLNNGEHTRYIAEISKATFVTEPLWKTDPSCRVKFKDVTRVIREL